MGDRTYIGIDPGLDGALALLLPDDTVLCYDTPTIETTTGRRKGRTYLVGEMRMLLEENVRGDYQVLALVEQPIGVLSGTWHTGLQQGLGIGLWQGLLAGLGVPHELVSPVAWKGKMGLSGKAKGASVALAQRLFPRASSVFVGPRGGARDGRADAALIAAWARRVGK